MKSILNNISQTNLFEAIDNPAEAQPSRIKEKPESLIATINNCINIPLAKIVRKEEKQNIPIEEKSEKQYTFVSILPQTLIINGKAKMINVKEKMLENIKKMNKTKINSEKVEIEVKEEPKIEFKEEPRIDIKYEPKEETNIYKERKYIEPVTKNFDFEKLIKEQEEKAASVIESRKAASESEQKLQIAVMEQTESEKRFQEELARKEELMRKLEAIINNRASIFEKETSTNENKIKQNNEQIERAQKIIDSNNKKADLLREQNDKMQSLYEAANMRIEEMQNGQRSNQEDQFRRIA